MFFFCLFLFVFVCLCLFLFVFVCLFSHLDINISFHSSIGGIVKDHKFLCGGGATSFEDLGRKVSELKKRKKRNEMK